MRLPLTILGVSALLVALLGANNSTTAQAAGPAAASGTAAALSLARTNELERRVVRATNRVRVRNGCAPVRPSASLSQAARQHSQLMARSGVLAHRLRGEPSLYARAWMAGYRDAALVGENLGYGIHTANRIVRGWLNSPSHRRNLLDCRWRRVGVGLAQAHGARWWTQDLARP